MYDFKKLFKDMILENTGSTARDHLANERTYLAWLRTSLSISAIGIAINQLVKTASAKAVGYIFVVLGVIFLFVATYRYYRTMDLLMESKFETNRLTVVAISLLSVAATAAALYAILVA